MKLVFSRRTAFAAAAIIASLPGLAAAAADAPQSEIVVLGNEEQGRVVSEMARAITVEPPVDKPVARFNDAICFGAFGASPIIAGEILDRMGNEAREVGLRVSETGCKPNVLVGFTNDPAEDIRKVRKQKPGIFKSLTRTEIDRALREEGPVKVLTSIETRTDSGEKIDPERPTNKLLGGSRIGLPVQRAMTGVIILLERATSVGKSTRQIADYALLRGLATLRPGAIGQKGGLETILSLFSEPNAPVEMTEFDRAYLRALYSGPPNSRAANLASAVARELGRSRN